MAGVFDAVEKLKRIYTYYNPVNNPYQKYYFKGSLLAEDNDPQKNETRMDRFYNLIDSINSNTEQIRESSTDTENGKSKYEDVYFQVPTVEETESETREEPEESEKSEDIVPNSPSLNIDNPIKSVGKTRENINVKQTQSNYESLRGVSLDDLYKQNPYFSKYFRITSRDGRSGKTYHNNKYVEEKGASMHAFDIVSQNGNYDDLYQFIITDPIMRKWMIDNNLNLIDEEHNPRYPGSNWTGPHFHIGPDTNVRDGFSNNLMTRSLTWRTLKRRLGQA